MAMWGTYFEFEQEPPTRDELAVHLNAMLGSSDTLDGVERDGPRVLVTCAPDPIVAAYVCAFMVGRGGVHLDLGTHAPAPLELPRFVSRRWRDWNLWQRLRFRLTRHRLVVPPTTDSRYR